MSAVLIRDEQALEDALDVVQQFAEHEIPCPVSAVAGLAAAAGDLEWLQQALAQDCSWRWWSIHHLAASGEVLSSPPQLLLRCITFIADKDDIAHLISQQQQQQQSSLCVDPQESQSEPPRLHRDAFFDTFTQYEGPHSLAAILCLHGGHADLMQPGNCRDAASVYSATQCLQN